MPVEVSIDSVKVSLLSNHRVVVLKEMRGERCLPIWIGPFEADAIATKLQGVRGLRPLTHDLLKASIESLGGTITQVVINDLTDDTFYARLVLEQDGHSLEVDCRPSDALALAVRVGVAVYVEEAVMEKASILPCSPEAPTPTGGVDEDKLSIFRDFVDSLDLDDLGEGGEKEKGN